MEVLNLSEIGGGFWTLKTQQQAHHSESHWMFVDLALMYIMNLWIAQPLLVTWVQSAWGRGGGGGYTNSVT